MRNLKSKKADKAKIDAEVKILQNLKTEYKMCTGVEWKPGMTLINSDKNKLPSDITQQEDKIKELQLKINQEMQRLSSLKIEYKNKTGADWAETENKNILTESNVTKLFNEIQKQGDKIRQLKSSKTEKNIIDEEVKKLLALKSDYKSKTGQDWNPSNITMPTISNKTIADTINKTIDSEKIINEIQKQGDQIRQLKASKAKQNIIDQEVKLLLKLMTDYLTAIGEVWKPSITPVTDIENKEKTNADQLSESIQKQGDKVRQLKDSKADKNLIDQEVKILLDLKNNYKTLTGEEWKSQKSDVTSKRKRKEDTSTTEKRKNVVNKEIVKTQITKDIDAGKTGTRLGMEVKKEENFFEWYSQIITKSGMIEYYDVSGCYILRPWSFAIWKIIKDFINKEITELGVQECYFPIFVTKTVLEKEKAHVTDFAPEVAWVTKCGESDLAEPIAIRPTSETVMYPAYAKWLKSDTELPLKLNQWNNVVVGVK